MPRDPDQYDFFVSYARADNAGGWISGFVELLLAEHRRFTGGRTLTPFFDKAEVRGLDDWQHRLHDALAHSRLFLAFISPNYFASEWCRGEWRAWIDTEIAKHILEPLDALSLLATNRLAEAEPLMRRVVAIFEKSLNEHHPNVATALNDLAQLLQATNRLAEAEPLLRRALAVFVASLEVSHRSTQTVKTNYARVLSEMGRSEPEVAAQLNALAERYGLSIRRER